MCPRSHSILSAELGLVDSALPSTRDTLLLLVPSFTPARRCLLGVSDNLAAQSQLKRHGNAVVDGFVYFEGSGGDGFSSRPPAETTSAEVSNVHRHIRKQVFRLDSRTRHHFISFRTSTNTRSL